MNTLVYLICAGLTLPTGSAVASEALRAMAEARQKEYQEIKNLGENATPSKISAIHNRLMGAATRQLSQEHAEKGKEWASETRAALKGMKLSRDGEHSSGHMASRAQTSPSNPTVDTTTGEQKGSGGAKKIEIIEDRLKGGHVDSNGIYIPPGSK